MKVTQGRLGLRVAASAALALAGVLGSCTSVRPELARTWPAEKPVRETLDIQVVRDETTVRLTNTTARSFGPFTLWLNQWHGRDVEGLAIGESVVLPLRSFRDEHGEAFRGGGFFATRDPDRVISAHIETENEVLGLVVVPTRRE